MSANYKRTKNQSKKVLEEILNNLSDSEDGSDFDDDDSIDEPDFEPEKSSKEVFISITMKLSDENNNQIVQKLNGRLRQITVNPNSLVVMMNKIQRRKNLIILFIPFLITFLFVQVSHYA